MELIHIIQKIVHDVVNAMNLTDICYGEVVRSSPLEVKLNNRLVIGEELLRLTSNVIEQKHTHTITGISAIYETTTVQPLTVGDKVIILKALKGSLYLILDRVVE